MTTQEIQQYLKEHIQYTNGYDITKGEYPLHANIGEGFEFTLDGKEYVTRASRRHGKRQLIFEIQTFIGVCGGAKHYYCNVCSYINNTHKDNPLWSTSGYLGGIKIPSENRTLEFDLGIPLTEEMLKSDPERYKFYKIGKCVTAITERKPFFDIIEYLKENVFDMNEWEFVIK